MVHLTVGIGRLEHADEGVEDKQTEKPDKSSKQIRAPIEEIRMGNGHLRAYRLKEAA